MTSEQRYAISALLQQKTSKKVIAQTIGVHPSTVYREISRNASRNGHYSKTLSHTYALERRERLPGNRAISPAIKKKALDLLRRQQWSPVQIAGYLRMQGIAISHETIYRMIRADHTGELAQYTHHHMKYRHHKLRARPYRSVSIPNRVSIHDRPAEADGTRFGDWEMDLILGKGQRSAILTLTERKTNMLLMARLKHGKRAIPLAQTVVRLLFPYRDSIRSITTDNGSEFAAHQLIPRRLGATVYFADSYAAWQKGSIENTNKLIRFFIPKQTDFNTLTDEYIMNVQHKLNSRPRIKLDFLTPSHCFFRHFC